jgi:hypothetical protein
MLVRITLIYEEKIYLNTTALGQMYKHWYLSVSVYAMLFFVVVVFFVLFFFWGGGTILLVK